jgi:hydrogenase expression/formation protein HypC
MCMGEICQVKEVGASGIALVRGRAGDQVARLMTLPETDAAPVGEGDWLVVHSGFALRRLSEQQALDALRIRAANPAADLTQLGIEETP